MTRPLLPPRGIFVSSKLLFDTSIPPVVRDTAIQLLALAWGKDETPPVSVAEFSDYTGKSVPTLYAHMGLLRDRGALRWRPAGTSTIIVTFIDGLLPPSQPDILQSNSENLELPYHIKHTPVKSTKTKSNTSNSENSEIPENQNRNVAGTNAIKDKYCELLGDKPDSWAQGESVAAKAIGAKYTVKEFEMVYQHMKAQKFWEDKTLMLRQIKPQMSGVLEYLRKNGHAENNSKPYQPEYTADDRAAADRINAARAKRGGQGV